MVGCPAAFARHFHKSDKRRGRCFGLFLATQPSSVFISFTI